MVINRQYLLIGAALGVGVWLALRAIRQTSVQDVAAYAGQAVTDAAGGVVLGIGDAIGVPRTDAQLCALAKANGDGWGASKFCPAGEFIEWNLSGRPSGGASGTW